MIVIKDYHSHSTNKNCAKDRGKSFEIKERVSERQNPVDSFLTFGKKKSESLDIIFRVSQFKLIRVNHLLMGLRQLVMNLRHCLNQQTGQGSFDT